MKARNRCAGKNIGSRITFAYPFIYKARKVGFTIIGENEIGIIESIDGNPVPPGKIFAKVVPDHNSFQDGEAFLKNAAKKVPR